FLFYIAVAYPSLVLMNRVTDAGGTAVSLASIAEHASDIRLVIVLTVLSCFCAVVLAVTLYAITRDVDHDLAMLILACRVCEGALGAIGIPNMVTLLSLGTGGAGTDVPDVATSNALRSFLLMPGQSTMTGAPFFTVGSLIFSYLLLRGRIVPQWLGW